MSKVRSFEIEFVTAIPERLATGRLYVSMPFATAIHLCACGCGTQVVTPFRPGRWRLLYDGSITVWPSVGNQGLACGSHYFIKRNQVRWVPRWLETESLGEPNFDRPGAVRDSHVSKFMRSLRRLGRR